MQVELPPSFLASPAWFSGGAAWLAALPQAVGMQCAAWRLRIAGELAHGSHAIVVPVERDSESFVLRMSPPGPDLDAHIRALRFWDGRGTARLFDADAASGAMLLERLGEPLARVPVDEAIPLLGAMMRRLAVPAPDDVPSTADLVRARLSRLEADWQALQRPFDRAILTEALDVGEALCRSESELAVNGDMHSAQVLRGQRETWLTVDPVLLRGDIAYDLARVLWTRLDEMAGPATIIEHFDAAAAAAGVERDHARDWVLLRAVDYWLWGLRAGLTEDPVRCRRLVQVFVT
ncbi:aminoglycoside O-phosphotransferase [Rhizocola hellebori]|uniref:Aminoglycoside O-phosphotransferase n=1 Tax=Rhizocola hellebori TaxID=1392758 RepID=A0A8J3QJ85_9ACTN|nr:aminoglycoside phosphotransferase family protein [Rhizocola hellebori]GIH10176.1 aminoglycoside O-phosphotransferase [Rhizocola hellebori]